MKSILTVDDSPSMRMMVAFTLGQGGYQVIQAVDGLDALEKLATQKSLDLVITDLTMPRMDGVELVRRIRADSAHKFVPVLLLTTNSSDEYKLQGRTAGATGWIVKPFRPEQLLNVVRKLIG